jgi:hypothetical protein
MVSAFAMSCFPGSLKNLIVVVVVVVIEKAMQSGVRENPGHYDNLDYDHDHDNGATAFANGLG